LNTSQHILDLMTNDLPEQDDLVIDEIIKDGKPLPWVYVRVLVHRAAKQMGVKIKTRIRNGKLLVWRVQP
jgi:hypoxanthine-guanine phosphoribosyltransferase